MFSLTETRSEARKKRNSSALDRTPSLSTSYTCQAFMHVEHRLCELGNSVLATTSKAGEGVLYLR